MRRLRKSRRGIGGVGFFIAVVIGVLLIWVVGYEIVYKKIGGGTSDATKSFTECNSELKKCACFFTTGRCPSDATIPIGTKKTDKCPPDSTICTQSNFAEKLKIKDDAEGTCCILDPNKPISESRLNQPPPTDEQGREIEGGVKEDVDCGKINTCSDYPSYPGYSDKLCYDDPCKEKKARQNLDVNCMPTDKGTCIECPKPADNLPPQAGIARPDFNAEGVCLMSYYDRFGSKAAELKEKNECGCISEVDKAKDACKKEGAKVGDKCGDFNEFCTKEVDELVCRPECIYKASIGEIPNNYACEPECNCKEGSILTTAASCLSTYITTRVQEYCCEPIGYDCCNMETCIDYYLKHPNQDHACFENPCGLSEGCIPNYADQGGAKKYINCAKCADKDIDSCSDYDEYAGDDLDVEIVRTINEQICLANPCEKTIGKKCVPDHTSDTDHFDGCEECPGSCNIFSFYTPGSGDNYDSPDAWKQDVCDCMKGQTIEKHCRDNGIDECSDYESVSMCREDPCKIGGCNAVGSQGKFISCS